MADHGHSRAEIAERLDNRSGTGHLRDAVYGAIDGAVTTFAIVAGVAGAGLPTGVILALGFANVLADGFSMAAGNYAGTKADRDDRARLRLREEDHIRRFPEGEREELRQILALKGVEGQALEDCVNAIAGNRDIWIETMLTEEYGLGPVESEPLGAATTTFGAFLLAGLLPLLPFLLPVPNAFLLSAVLTGITFVLIGAIKSIWSLAPWWLSAFETLAIGGTAAVIAYFVGGLFHA